MTSNAENSNESESDLASDLPLNNNQDETVVLFDGTRLFIDGFSYTKNHIDSENKMHWKCRRCHTDDCRVQLITSHPEGSKLTLYTSLRKLKHDHSPESYEIETINEAVMIEEEEKLELQASTDHEFNLNSETLCGTEPLAFESSIGEIDSRKEIDENVSGEEFKQTSPSKVEGIIYKTVVGPSRLVSLTGKHSPSLVNMNKSQKIVNHDQRSSQSGIDLAPCFVSIIPVKDQFPISKQSEDQHVGKVDGQKQMEMVEEKTISVPADTNNPANNVQVSPQMCIKMIGKRLCIDGYIYSKVPHPGSVPKWICRKYYRLRGCRARVSTSNPSSGKNLTVYEITKHNHPPNEFDVEEAELQAKLEQNQLKRKSFLADQSSKELSDSDGQNPILSNLRRCPKPRSVVIADAESKRQLQSEARKQSFILRKRRRKTKLPRLCYNWGYRQFLMEFQKEPIFEKQSIVRALRVLYSSVQGLSRTHETIVKNRAKIERDLEALRNNPRTIITALKSYSTTVQTAKGGSDANKDTNLRVEMQKKRYETQNLLPRRQEKVSEMALPNPAFSPMKKDLHKPPFITLKEDDPKLEKETTFIDLTDDSEDLLGTTRNTASVGGINSPPNKTNETMNTLRSLFSCTGGNTQPVVKREPPDFHTDFHNFAREMGAFPFDLHNQFAIVVPMSTFFNATNFQPNRSVGNQIYNTSYSGNGPQIPPNFDVQNMRNSATEVREHMRNNSTSPATQAVSPRHISKYV